MLLITTNWLHFNSGKSEWHRTKTDDVHFFWKKRFSAVVFLESFTEGDLEPSFCGKYCTVQHRRNLKIFFFCILRFQCFQYISFKKLFLFFLLIVAALSFKLNGCRLEECLCSFCFPFGCIFQYTVNISNLLSITSVWINSTVPFWYTFFEQIVKKTSIWVRFENCSWRRCNFAPSAPSMNSGEIQLFFVLIFSVSDCLAALLAFLRSDTLLCKNSLFTLSIHRTLLLWEKFMLIMETWIYGIIQLKRFSSVKVHTHS